MKKLIFIFIILGTFLVNINIIKNVNANVNIDEITKPIVVLCGDEYEDYLEYEGYSIISSNLNTNKCGDYKIIYQNDITKEKYQKKIYVKNEEELLSDKCYSENYMPIYGSENLSHVYKGIYYKGYSYFAISEQVGNDLYNLYLLKLDDEEIIFKKELIKYAKATVGDFLISQNEIIVLLNYINNDTQDVIVKYLNHQGDDIKETDFSGNSFDKGVKIFETNESYFVVIESSSNSGSIFSDIVNKRGIYVVTINKNFKDVIDVNYIKSDYEINLIDTIESNEGFVFLTMKYDKSIKMRILEFHLFSYNDKKFLKTIEFKKTITEEPLKLKANDRNEIYLMTSEYDYNLKTNKYNLYYVFNTLETSLLNSYYYKKEGNAILCDYLVNSHNNIEVLYNLIDTKKSDIYGYIYQVIEKEDVVLEIENYNSTMMSEGFLDFRKILFIENNNIIINEINYIKFTMLNNQTFLSNHELTIYPILYIDGKKIQLDLNKSIIEYDLSNYGIYDSKFYFSSDNVDVIIYGTVEVLPYTNINNDESYDINLKLSFNGKGILNDYKIENNHIITTPGSYKLEVIGKDNKSYNIQFQVEPITDNNPYLQTEKVELNIDKEIVYSSSNIKINNNVQENDIVNSNISYNWTIFIPLCASIVLIFSLLRKRG